MHVSMYVSTYICMYVCIGYIYLVQERAGAGADILERFWINLFGIWLV